MHQFKTGEKATAAASALAALLILGAAVTAQQSRNAPITRLSALESDLRFQLNLAHRLDGEALKASLAKVDRTLEAWRASPKSGEDDRLLTEWFESSIDASMPGTSGVLPATPKFGAEPPPVAATPAPTAATVAAPQPTQQAPTIAATPHAAPPATEVKPPATAAAPQTPVAKSTPQPKPSETQPPPAVEHSIAVHNPAGTPAQQPALPHQRPAALPPAAPAALASIKVQPVTINLSELNSRIEGYHHGLKQIEAELVAGREQLNQDRLTAIVGRLEELANQYRFIRLYFDSLTADERRAVTVPRQLQSTVELVERELAQAEQNGDFLSDFETPTAAGPSPLAKRLHAVAQQAQDAVASTP